MHEQSMSAYQWLHERVDVPVAGPETQKAWEKMGIRAECYECGLLHPEVEYEPQPPWLNEPVDPMDDDGTVEIPQRPGLGYDIDWDYVDEHRIEDF